jgi:hypothetical protein
MNEKMIGIMPSVPESKNEMELFREKIAEILKETDGSQIGIALINEFGGVEPIILGQFSGLLSKVVEMEDIDKLIAMNMEEDSAISSQFNLEFPLKIEVITDRTVFIKDSELKKEGSKMSSKSEIFIGKRNIGEMISCFSTSPFELGSDFNIFGINSAGVLFEELKTIPEFNLLEISITKPSLEELIISDMVNDEISNINQ